MADLEAGFGGLPNVFELTKEAIKKGAAAIHLEDQDATQKKCGHLGGKVLVPTAQFIRVLQAARLAADVMDVPTVIIARTDAREVYGMDEALRRGDDLYKYAVVIEYNTDPVVPGLGSAIFMHVWRGAGQPTAGCVAMAEADLLRFLRWLDIRRNPVIIFSN